MFIYLVVRHKIILLKLNFINHNFKLEFVDSGLYLVQDENNLINPLLQVGSGFKEKKVVDPDLTGQKSTDPTGYPTYFK